MIDGDDRVVSPGSLPPVATEDAIADAIDAVVTTPDDSVVSDGVAQSWLDAVKDETGQPKGDLTLTTPKNDPLNAGATPQQHRTAQWGALLWKHAVVGRRDDSIHGRGVHYVIVSTAVAVPSPNPATDDNPNGTDWRVYRNTTTCYDYLAGALKTARLLGYIPHSGIIDEKNNRDEYRVTTGDHDLPSDGDTTDLFGDTAVSALSLPSPPSFNAKTYRQWGDSETSAERSSDDSYRDRVVSGLTDRLLNAVEVDTEAEQPYHIEVWSEKTLPTEVKRAARRAGAAVIVEGEGCMSLTQAFEFGERVERVGKPAIVLYLADFDPAGDDMPAQVANKFEWLKTNPQFDLDQRVYVDRLALTGAQVARHDLPRQPLDPEDFDDAYKARIERFEDEHGRGATELNALEADIELYQRLVRDGVERYRDQDLDQKRRDAREAFREACENAVRNAIDDTGVPDHLDAITEWMQDVDELVAEYEDEFAELREDFEDNIGELKDEDAHREFTEAHNSVGSTVDVPDFDVPDGEASPPDDPLYDSARDYLATVARARARVDGGDRA
jgi:hypothetical protein